MGRGRHALTAQGAPGGRLLAAVPVAFLVVFFAYPLIRIVLASLTLDGGLDLAPFGEIISKGSLRGAIWFTVWQATLSTLLTLVFALPGAWALARYEFRGRRLLNAAVTVPFVLPTVVVGAAYLALLGPDGPLGVDLRRTAWAILIAHVFFNYAVVVRTVGSFWRLLDPRIEEAARALGASRWQAFRRVTLPLLMPSIAAAASIVFVFTFTSFGVVLILGGFSYATIEVAVWREATINLDLAVSAALALVQLTAIAGSLMLYSRYQQRRARQQSLRRPDASARSPRTGGERLAIGATIVSMVVYLGAPIAVLLSRSLRTSEGLGLTHFQGLFDGSGRLGNPLEAIGNSLWFAAVATLLAVTVGMSASLAIARRPARAGARLDTLLMLPLGASAVTIGLGFLVAFDRPVDLRTSPWLIPVAHALIAVPFVIRTATPVLRSVRSRLREAASMLGASPRRVFREIDLPIVSRAALVGAGFSFAVSLGEFGATAFLVRPDRPTIPTAIFRLLGQPGQANFGQAMAMSVVLMAVTTAVIMAIDRFRSGDLGEF